MHRWPRRLEPQRRIRVTSALCRIGPGAPAGGVRDRRAAGAIGRKCITEEPGNERPQPRADCGPWVGRWKPVGSVLWGSRVYPPACHFRRTDGRQRSVCGVRTGSRWATLPKKSGRPRRPRYGIRSRPSRPACRPSGRLLILALQQKVDAFSDEGRGVPVSRVRGQLPHPFPRCFIHAEGDDSRLSNHAFFFFPLSRETIDA